jgi:hypothetical protein
MNQATDQAIWQALVEAENPQALHHPNPHIQEAGADFEQYLKQHLKQTDLPIAV